MSFFNKDETPSEVPFANPDAVTMADLVGEGKKYADEAALAKALAHSQNHIQSLESGMNELRSDLTTRVTVEDALKQISSAPAAKVAEPAIPAVEPPAPKEETVKALSPEDIQKTIEETLKAREVEGTRNANLTTTQTTLKRIYGDGADRFVEGKAAELGLSVDQLIAQAQVSPTAFFKLLDVDPKSPAATTKAQSYSKPNINRAPDANALQTMEDFKALRAESPTKFWSPAVQSKLLKMKLSQLNE